MEIDFISFHQPNRDLIFQNVSFLLKIDNIGVYGSLGSLYMVIIFLFFYSILDELLFSFGFYEIRRTFIQ